ncbi:MAG: phospholipid carrier-dependent glycosyltransferase, partial [Ktedonobacterales bacterium]
MPENGIRRGKRARTRDASASGPTPSATRTGALAARVTSAPTAQPSTSITPAGRAARLLGALTTRATRWLERQDWTVWALLLITLLALIPRLYGLNWDSGNHLHPDEREIVFKAMCVTLPATPRAASCDPAYTGPGWLLSASSPLNTHFFAYGSFPQYLLAVATHGMAWFSKLTGLFRLTAGNAWDDFNHFTLIGRVLSALFDAGSVLLTGLIARRLTGRRAALLAAAFVAVIPFNVQVAHFYAVDTLLLFFVLLTLYGCIQLAQGPLPRAAKPNDGDEAVPRPAFWSAWGGGVFIGVSFGLAMATKVSALPLLAPILVALLLRWRRRGLEEALLALLGLGAAVVITYLLTSPYTLIDWKNFQLQVNEQTNLSQGKLDYPYVRQFAGTTPFVYEIRQLLLYDMGLPLGLAGLAGIGWAISRVWRRLDSDWGILVVWTLGYFAVIGSAYTKFSRYMLPVFTPLAICAAAMIAALAMWGTRRVALPRSVQAQPTPTAPFPTGVGGAGGVRISLWHGLTARTARITNAATRLWG